MVSHGARSSVDRVLASEAKGRRFDSCRARQSSLIFEPHHTQKLKNHYHLDLNN